jgi:hypothetical protein
MITKKFVATHATYTRTNVNLDENKNEKYIYIIHF